MTTPEMFGPEDGRSYGERRRSIEPRRESERADGTFAPRRLRDRRVSRAVTPQAGAPVSDNDLLGFPLSDRQLDACLRAALLEDGAYHDIATAASVLSARRAHATIVARQSGILAGIPLAIAAFRLFDSNAALRVDVEDGDRVTDGAPVVRITALSHAILSAERVALNFLRHLSGIATLTSQYVEAVRGTSARIVDTWKTTPGLRDLEHYAVRAGGALGVRRDGLDVVQIRDSHLTAVNRDVTMVVRRSRVLASDHTRIEVACRSPAEVRSAVAAGVDGVLLDGMTPAHVRECVEIAAARAFTQVTGDVRLDSVRSFAQAGVDRIAVDALTQRAPALELELEFEAG
jgi:nicotinate-nucleotide pyrophosphorylase (carboxylating)